MRSFNNTDGTGVSRSSRTWAGLWRPLAAGADMTPAARGRHLDACSEMSTKIGLTFISGQNREDPQTEAAASFSHTHAHTHLRFVSTGSAKVTSAELKLHLIGRFCHVTRLNFHSVSFIDSFHISPTSPVHASVHAHVHGRARVTSKRSSSSCPRV